MASRGAPSLLALEVEGADWTSADRPRNSRVDPQDVARESTVGSAADPVGASPPRIRGRGEDRGDVSNEERQASVANLEDLSRQSRKANCGHRLLHRADD